MAESPNATYLTAPQDDNATSAGDGVGEDSTHSTNATTPIVDGGGNFTQESNATSVERRLLAFASTDRRLQAGDAHRSALWADERDGDVPPGPDGAGRPNE